MTEPASTDSGQAAVETPALAPQAKPKKRRSWLRGGLELLAILAVFFAIRGYQTRNLAEGPVPSLPTALLDGSAAPERPVAVHFFASWCGVCQAEEGNVRTLAEHHEVLAIASQSGGASEVEAYLSDHDLGPAAVALDPRGELARSFGVSAFPATFFLGPDGHIVTSEVGYTTTLGLLLRAWWAQ